MKNLLLLTALILCSLGSYATHLISADITYTHVSGNDYEVTLTIYRDCSGINANTNQIVNFTSTSCGQNFDFNIPYIITNDVSQVCPGQTTTCNGGTAPGIQQFIYMGIVTLTPCSDWIMNWNQSARSPSITNLVSPANSNLYIQNTLNNIIGTNNNSPQYLNLPYLYLDANSLAIYNHGVSDADGDSLHYSLATPLTTPGPPGTPMSFAPGHSQSQPMITNFVGMWPNPQTGAMQFTPSQNQVAVVSTLIKEFRNGVFIASQIREMQIIVNSAITNQPPTPSLLLPWANIGAFTILSAGPSVDSIGTNSIKMCTNDNVCFEVSFTDPDGDNVSISSNVLASMPGATLSITNNNTPNPTATLCWNPTVNDIGLNVLSIAVKDDACPIFGTQTFTYDITVTSGISAGSDQTICGTQGVQLNATGGATYTWLDATTNIQVPVGPAFSCNPCSNPIATPSATTNYYVLNSLPATCGNTDTITVTVAQDFTADVIGDTALCGITTRQLDVNILTGPAGTYTYTWNNAGTLNNFNIQNPIASPITSTWYTPTITSPQGCTKIVDSAFVEISQTFLNNESQSICQGDSLLIYGTYQSAAGTYYDSLQTINGCDSILSTTLSLLNFTSQFTFIDNGLGNYSFSNTSTGGYTLSDWNFGDGTTSSVINPNHTFAVNGTFIVVLAIADSSVSCIKYYMDTITVTTATNILPCNAGFVVYPDTANTNITIYNSSTGNTLTYFWDFGDGSTSTLQNPSHTYLGAGPYQLCVTIDDGNGCIDTFCDSVSVTGVAFKGGGFTINVISTPIITNINSRNSSIGFSILPNPNNGTFTIYKMGGLNKEVKIKIFDISSRLIAEKKLPVNKEKIEINIQEYRKGIYFVQLITDNKTSIKRIIKN